MDSMRFLELFLFGILLGFGNLYAQDISQDEKTCREIIPKFITQVMQQQHPLSCDEQGAFPQPGNCTVFFKCVVQKDHFIQPFVEYCSVGYNFVDGICVPNMNATDCPQFSCRIPDGDDNFEAGNDIHDQHDTLFSSTISSVSSAHSPSTTTAADNGPSEEIHSEQLQATATPTNQKNKSYSNYIASPLSVLILYTLTLVIFH